LKILFGQTVYDKASVHYPCISQELLSVTSVAPEKCRFLFVGTQFEIKGGEALLKAFRRVYEQVPSTRLDIITHFPTKYIDLAESCAGIHVHEARFSRDEIHSQFMNKADVLVLPTYAETFGMVALEALAHGLALIATDVYALREIVEDGKNGRLLTPPISIWDGVLPSRNFSKMKHIKKNIAKTDTTLFEKQLENAMKELASNSEVRLAAMQASVRIMKERFAC
jgi:glycosyltransferase involved in cell wall biosynthesis